MKPNERLAIGIGVVALGAAWFWQNRNSQILQNILGKLGPGIGGGPISWPTVYGSGAPGDQGPYAPGNVSPSTGGPVQGPPVGAGSIVALPGTVEAIPLYPVDPINRPGVYIDPNTGNYVSVNDPSVNTGTGWDVGFG